MKGPRLLLPVIAGVLFSIVATVMIGTASRLGLMVVAVSGGILLGAVGASVVVALRRAVRAAPVHASVEALAENPLTDAAVPVRPRLVPDGRRAA